MKHKIQTFSNNRRRIKTVSELLNHPSSDFQVDILKKTKEYNPSFKISSLYRQRFHDWYQQFNTEYGGDLSKLDFINDEIEKLGILHVLDIEIADWKFNTIPEQIIDLASEEVVKYPKKDHLLLNGLISYLDNEQREIYKYLNRLKEAQKDESGILETVIDENVSGATGLECLRILHHLGVMEYLKSNHTATPENWAAVLGRILGKNESTITRNIRSFFTNRDSGGDSNDFREGKPNEPSRKLLKNIESVKKVK